MTKPRESGFFSGRDGTSLYYEIFGCARGEGPPIVLCYGLTCRRDHWIHQIQHFASQYHLITFDYRGHHSSEMPKNDRHLTINWCASDLVSLFDHLNLEKAAVFGHSMGVPVMVEAFKELENRMGPVVFICGAVHRPFSYMFNSNRLEAVYRIATSLYGSLPDTTTRLWKWLTQKNSLNFFLTSRLGFNPSKASAKDVENYMDGVHSTPMPIFISLLSDYQNMDKRPLLGSIHSPTLIVAGEMDFITPLSVQREMASLMPKAKLEVIPFGSHNAHMDYPDRVNSLIADFLREEKYV